MVQPYKLRHGSNYMILIINYSFYQKKEKEIINYSLLSFLFVYSQ